MCLNQLFLYSSFWDLLLHLSLVIDLDIQSGANASDRQKCAQHDEIKKDDEIRRDGETTDKPPQSKLTKYSMWLFKALAVEYMNDFKSLPVNL